MRCAGLPQAVMRPGETIIKGHRSYELVQNLQLGIMFSLAKVTSQRAASAAITEADHKVCR